jgi:hypothetical protein
MNARPRNTRALVEIELHVPEGSDADDIVHAIWSAGDPEDTTNATVWVKDVEEIKEDAQ